jgi:hypothetical protein
VRPTRRVIEEMIDDFIDAVQRLGGLLDGE